MEIFFELHSIMDTILPLVKREIHSVFYVIKYIRTVVFGIVCCKHNYSHTDRDRDIQTDRHRDTHSHTHTHTHLSLIHI